MNHNNSSENNDYKNDLFTIFFDTLITLHLKHDHNKIHEILIGGDGSNTHKFVPENSNCAKYVDEDTIVPIRVWTDNETRKYLDIIHYVCNDENIVISLNNKILESWLYEMNTIMSRFFYKSRNIECTRDCRITFKIENHIWDEFISRCDALNITQLNGFKSCVNDFIQQRAKIYL